MDKTHNISLGGFSFLIEEKAYQELSNYLKLVRIFLGNNADTEEIIYDVEQRMAELLPPKMAGRQVIIPSDVDFLIAKLGKPEQYIDEDFSEGNLQNTQNSKEKTEKFSFKNKKLYRDMERKVLGGVLAGLSRYFNIDVAWVRVMYMLFYGLLGAFFAFSKLLHLDLAPLLAIFEGVWVLIYFVFWVIVPHAKTTAEKLQMQGKSVTIDTISSFKNKEIWHEKKFRRSRKDRKFGGVFGGLSQLLGVQSTWLRIIFVVLVLGFIPFLKEISSVFVTLYLILLIAVPSEKRNSVFDKNPSEENSKEENMKITEYQEDSFRRNNFGNDIKKGVGTIFRTIFKGFVYLTVGFIAFILLIISISLFLALLGVGVAGWGIGFTGLMITDFLPHLLAGEWQMWVSYIAGTLLLILPFSIITILCLKLFSKNGYQTPRFWVLANVFVFFFGVFGIILVIINTLTHFQTSAWLEEKKTIAPTDTISLSFENTSNVFYSNDLVIFDNFYFDDKNILIRDKKAEFQILKTSENQPFIIIKKRGKGKNISEARTVTEKIQFPVKIEENRIVFPSQIFCGKDAKIREQCINIYLYLPEGVCITSTDNHFPVSEANSYKWYNIKNGGVIKMTENGLMKQ